MITKDKTEDHRYTISVFLIRSDRDRYWDFHCVYCREKVTELSGDVAYMVDVSNDASLLPAPERHRCRGNARKHCRMWYAFEHLS